MKKNTIEHLGQASKKILAVPGRCYIAASTTRSRTIIPVHQKISKKFSWYEKWHLWSYKKINHQHVHWAVAIFYMLALSAFILLRSGVVFAADFTDSWNFSSISSFLLDGEVEQDGSTVSLKPQEYSTDSNTSALFHFNESAGSSADDSSSNNNDLTTVALPGFISGNLNNALSLNGATQYASAVDSTSLSVTGQISLESWIKPNSIFNNNTDFSQTILDKGSYQLGLDRGSGKAFFEIENNNSSQWTKQLGDGQAGSWDFNHATVESSVADGSNIYVGLGYTVGDADIWKWDGNTWSKIGGDGINSSWNAGYEMVRSLAVNNGTLFAGLGSTMGDAEVWSCNLASNCNTWSKIGGDGIGIGGAHIVNTLIVHGGNVYAGTGSTAGLGDVYIYNGGTSWTQIGGDGLNGGWASATYENVLSFASDGASLYAGLGTSTGDSEVWKWDGSSWLKIGGDGVNGSWNTNYETVESLTAFGGNVYAGLGLTSNQNDGEVWRWNGSSWLQIGGDGVNGSWSAAGYNKVLSFANDGTNLYAGTGQGTNTGQVWKWNGSSWLKIGGDGVAGTFVAPQAQAMTYANSKLFVGVSTWSTSYNVNGGSSFWEYNGSTWSVLGGNNINQSWGGYGINRVVSSTVHNGNMYYGLGAGTGNALVYEYNGSTATLIGGNGNNGSWSPWIYEEVTSMTSYKGGLYVGLGTTPGEGEVWRWDGTTWTKVGGDSLSGSWSTAAAVSAMTVYNGNLYATLGTSAVGSNSLYKYDGATWTLVKNTWNPTTFTYVQALTVWNGQLCVAGGYGSSGASVFCGDGDSSWTLVGGGGTNNSWDTQTFDVLSMAVYNGNLIVSRQNWNNSGPVYATIWQYDGSTWTKIGGDSVNSSWSDQIYKEAGSLVVYNGQLYVGTGTTSSNTAGADIWRWNDSTWEQIGGNGIAGSWTFGMTMEAVNTLTAYKGRLYAGLGNNSNADALVYSFGNNGYIESTSTSLSADWHHLAATYDGVTMKLFIDGALSGSSVASVTGVDNNLPLLVGSGYGSSFGGDGQVNFNGQIDEVRISNIARTNFTTKPYSASEQSITLSDPVRLSGIASWVGFSANETTNGGTIAYRLSSDDGATWKYWNGGAWSTSSGLNQASSASDINAHIDAFPVTFQGLRWQAVLKGDGTQKVTLNSVEVTSDADADAPSLNASNLQAFSSNGGAQISGGSWTNVAQPYFSWNSASDALSDIYGYCLYLGQTPSENPVTSKGLLGSSPVETGGHCQYVVSSTSLDLSQAGVLATPLGTSNSSYYLNVRAIDSAGNVFGSSEQFEFKFDNTAPANPSYITAPSEFISSKEVTFTWPTSGGDAAADDHSLVAGLQYKIGTNGAWRGDGVGGAGNLANDGSYTTRNDPDYPDINNGNNIFYFRTIDNAGNVSASYVSATLRLNTGAPTGPQNLIATPSSNTSNSFAFSWSPPASFAGLANSLTYCYTINTLPTENTCTYTSAGVTSLPASAYATQPGDNTFYVVAKDNNINYATAASTTFTANTSAPGMPLDLEIADISTKATSSWKVALSWSEPTDVGAGVSSYKVFRSNTDSNYVQVASTAGSSFVDSGLSQQTYYYKVKACDSANNCGALSSSVSKYPTGRFTTAANITSNPTVSAISTRKATIRWSTDRVSDSKVSIGTTAGQYEPFQIASGDQVTDHSVQMTNLTPGTTYFVKASWTDEDGNTGNSSEFTFQTEPAPSTQEVITTRVGLNSAQIRLTSVSAARVVIQYGKSDSFGGVKEISTSLARSTYDVELAGLDDNTKYYYRLNTYDADGNEYIGSTVLTFTTPARPHISDLRFEPVSGEPTSTQRVTWVTNVDTTSGVTYGKDGTNGTDVLNSTLTRDHEIIIRGLDDNSIYFLLAQSRDIDGNLAVSERQSFQTALDTRPPVVKDLAVETVVKGTGSDARGQIIVTWTTDEPSTSQVAFGEGTSTEGVTSMTTEDANLTTEHVVIVSDLSTARVYNVQAVSRDKARNEAKSDSQATIINRGTDSILSIIVNVLQQIFGFEAK